MIRERVFYSEALAGYGYVGIHNYSTYTMTL